MKKYFLACYVFLPPLFYMVPFFFSNEKGDVVLHFFKTFIVSKFLFIKFSVLYFLLGFLIVGFVKKIGFTIENRKKSRIEIDFLLSFCFVFYFFFPISYVAMVFYYLTYIIMGSYKPGKFSLIILLLISIYELLFNNSRFPLIYTGLIFNLDFIENINWRKLLISCVIAVFFLVYILQPLRSGFLPFSSQSRLSTFAYLYQHVNPIYIGAYLSYELNFNLTILLSEIIPFSKTLFNYESVIDRLADVGLPRNIIYIGIRHGSNSTMYFHLVGILVISACFVFIRKLLSVFNYEMLNNAVLLYFIIQGPFFVRRAIASYLLDIIMLFVIAIPLVFIKQYNYQNKFKIHD